VGRDRFDRGPIENTVAEWEDTAPERLRAALRRLEVRVYAHVDDDEAYRGTVFTDLREWIDRIVEDLEHEHVVGLLMPDALDLLRLEAAEIADAVTLLEQGIWGSFPDNLPHDFEHPLSAADEAAWAVIDGSLENEAAFRAAAEAVLKIVDDLKTNAWGAVELEAAAKGIQARADELQRRREERNLRARPPGTKTGGRPVEKAEGIKAIIAELVNAARPHSPSEISAILRRRYEIEMPPTAVSTHIDAIKKADAKRDPAERWLHPPL
jgi:DNA-binding transcriptional ArsR family regulator